MKLVVLWKWDTDSTRPRYLLDFQNSKSNTKYYPEEYIGLSVKEGNQNMAFVASMQSGNGHGLCLSIEILNSIHIIILAYRKLKNTYIITWMNHQLFVI